MSKLILLLMFYNLLNLNMASEYEPPKSIEYPFGDEEFNTDISEDRVQEEPRDLHVEIIKDIYTFCPNVTEDDDEVEIPYNDDKCSKCDIRPTVDKSGVLVECFNCSDVSTLTSGSSENDIMTPSHILFLTTYLEVANYSAPKDPDDD